MPKLVLQLKSESRTGVIMTTGIMALAPIPGAVSGYYLGEALSGGGMEAILAFAAANFLYLSAEELLKEAHEVTETLLSTSLFFAAFLALPLIDINGSDRPD